MSSDVDILSIQPRVFVPLVLVAVAHVILTRIISLLVEQSTQKQIEQAERRGLKSFILEYRSSKPLRIKDQNGLILDFTVDHKDGRETERELASTAREDLQQLVCGDRKPSNRYRSAVSAAKNIG
jgi:hypothetical protein